MTVFEGILSQKTSVTGHLVAVSPINRRDETLARSG